MKIRMPAVDHGIRDSKCFLSKKNPQPRLRLSLKNLKIYNDA